MGKVKHGYSVNLLKLSWQDLVYSKISINFALPK